MLLIQRLLREFPRHRDIIALCKACEALALVTPGGTKPRLSRAEISAELSAEEESQ